MDFILFGGSLHSVSGLVHPAMIGLTLLTILLTGVATKDSWDETIYSIESIGI